jgi:hypothetical protein
MGSNPSHRCGKPLTARAMARPGQNYVTDQHSVCHQQLYFNELDCYEDPPILFMSLFKTMSLRWAYAGNLLS